MDFSWLTNILSGLVKVFKPLAAIKHWKVWAAIWDLIQRLRTWYKWYQQNVQARMRAILALYNRLYQRFVAPILKIVDTIRRLTGVVGIFNRKLAAKLNTLFLRVEGYLLAPLNAVVRKINAMERIFSGFLTPLGYLDRATLLNSFWRDIGHLKELWRNPFSLTFPTPATPARAPLSTSVAPLTAYLAGQSSPLQPRVDFAIEEIRVSLGE